MYLDERKPHWDQLDLMSTRWGTRGRMQKDEASRVNQPVIKYHFPWVKWFSFYSRDLQLVMKLFFPHLGEFFFCPVNNSPLFAFKSTVPLLNNSFQSQADTANCLWLGFSASPAERCSSAQSLSGKLSLAKTTKNTWRTHLIICPLYFKGFFVKNLE